MTRATVVEYAAAVRRRYVSGSRAETKMILDKFCKATGYHRKSAIRVLQRVRRRQRGRRYGSEVDDALRVIAES